MGTTTSCCYARDKTDTEKANEIKQNLNPTKGKKDETPPAMPTIAEEDTVQVITPSESESDPAERVRIVPD